MKASRRRRRAEARALQTFWDYFEKKFPGCRGNHELEQKLRVAAAQSVGGQKAGDK